MKRRRYLSIARRAYMKTWIICLFTGLCGFIFPAYAQNDIQLSVQAPKTVETGQVFDVTYTMNAQGGSEFQAPGFRGFELLFGPSQSQSSSVQVINGQYSQSFRFSYSYRLRATKEGKYTFGKASVKIDGKRYESEPLSIDVIKNSSPSGKNQGAGQARSQQSSQGAEISQEDLFVKTSANKHKVYVGEQLIVSCKIFTNVPVRQYGISKNPAFKGFWSENLKTEPNDQREEVLNGKRYMSASVYNTALFPQETGKLKIEPIEIEAIAQMKVQRQSSNSIFDLFDDPFFSQVQNVKKTLKGSPIQIEVRELPAQGRPASFNGAVGDFSGNFTYDAEKKVKANEALTFKFTVKGKGNIALLQQPDIVFPPDFEVYEPKVSQNIQTSTEGVSGSKTFEFTVVPRNHGVYKIDAFEYSFFHPEKESYRRIEIPEITLNIAPGIGSSAIAETKNTISIKEKNDIEHIVSQTSFKTKGKVFFLSPLFFLLFALTILAWFALLILYKNKIKRSADLVGMKNKKAFKDAQKCLRKAKQFMEKGDIEAFHVEISQALWGFIANKFNIPTAALSIESAREILSEKKLSEDLIGEFVKTLEHCEFQRFSPSGKNKDTIETLYSEALDIIYKIVNELK